MVTTFALIAFFGLLTALALVAVVATLIQTVRDGYGRRRTLGDDARREWRAGR
ncbi:hypothetical protein VD659_07935 [Herbiconiux sp. 11R-BC]|uniref:hypothetical protein n=1 Tax=Herbiconiux sp. 11R-BC TaxID=3111637 RepID=UPI003C060086